MGLLNRGRKLEAGGDFAYLGEDMCYFDTACQSLRPQPVIDVLSDYYTKYGSCGERVKYEWGRKVDEKVEETREAVLKFLKLNSKDYFVSFTLNTTYGINLILNQLKTEGIRKVVTSDIEHNSPFLSTMAFAKKNGVQREVMARERDGSIDLSDKDFAGAVVVVNAVSNIDGRKLGNLHELVKKVHGDGGLIIVDAAQAMGHHHEMLERCEADAICFSAHKMYAPSLGGIIAKKTLLDKIETTFIGGGMVDDVTLGEYQLSAESPNHIYTAFEAGLQAWGEIIALGEAVKWIGGAEKSSKLEEYSKRIFDFLKTKPKIHVVNEEPTPVMAIYHEDIDGHLLSEALSAEGIMTRSGYFCCHYYLDHVMHYPPLVRISLGMHNRESDVEKLIRVLEKAAR